MFAQGNVVFPEVLGSFHEEGRFEGGCLGALGSGDLDIWTGLTVAARPAELDLPDLDLSTIVSLEPHHPAGKINPGGAQELLGTAGTAAGTAAAAAAGTAAAAAADSADEAATASGSGYPPPLSPPEACTAESSGSDAATHERAQGVAGGAPHAQHAQQQQQQPKPPVPTSPSGSNSTGFAASDSAAPETSAQSGGSSAQSSKTQSMEQQQRQQQHQQQNRQEGEQEEEGRSGQEEAPPPGVDPKAYARQMRNRESAAQSRVRKKKYMEEMEHKMQHLEAANAQLNGMVQQLSAENAALKCQLANAYSGQKPPSGPPGGYAVPYPGAYPHPYVLTPSAPVPAPKLPISAPKRRQSGASSDAAGSKGKRAKSVPKAAAAASAVLLSVVCCLALVAGPWATLAGPPPRPLSASAYGGSSSSSELARSGRVLAAIGMGGDATAAAAALLPSDLDNGSTARSTRSSSSGGFRERRRGALAALPSGVAEVEGGGLSREEQQEQERRNDRRLTLPQLGPITEGFQYRHEPSRGSRRASKGAIDRGDDFREAEAGALLVPEGMAVYQDAAAPAPESSSTVARWSEYPDVPVLHTAAADLSVIESLWDVLDAKLDARECHCISHQLKAEVKRVWLSITIDTCRQLVEPMTPRAPRVIHQEQSGHIERA